MRKEKINLKKLSSSQQNEKINEKTIKNTLKMWWFMYKKFYDVSVVWYKWNFFVLLTSVWFTFIFGLSLCSDYISFAWIPSFSLRLVCDKWKKKSSQRMKSKSMNFPVELKQCVSIYLQPGNRCRFGICKFSLWKWFRSNYANKSFVCIAFEKDYIEFH